MSGVSIATGVSALDVLNPSVATAVVGAAIGVTGAAVTPDAVVTAGANFAAIQAAINASREVQIGIPGGGEIYIDKTLIVPSHRRLVIAEGTTIRLAPGSTCQMLRNEHAQNTVAAEQFDHSVSGICTVTENGHTRQVGDQVYIENIGGDATLLGLHTITAASGNKWSFAAAGTGTATGQGYVGPYRPVAGSNFVRGATATAVCNVSGNVLTLAADESAPIVGGMTVTGGALAGQTIMGPSGNRQSGSGTTWRLSSSGGTQSGITVTFTPPATLVRVYDPGHEYRIGDSVYVGGSISGSSAFTGPIEVSEVQGDYWYYHTTGTTAETATGTANVLADRDITISGAFDGDYTKQTNSYTDSLGLVAGNVSRIDWSGAVVKHCFKFAIWNFNCSDIVGSNITFDTFSDGFHCQAPWRRVALDGVHGNTNDDFTSFANPNPSAGSFTRFSSPSGMGSGYGVKIRNLFPKKCDYSAAVKITGNTGYNLGDFEVDGVYGRCNAWISITDDTASLVGTTGNTLKARNLRAEPRFPNSYGLFLGLTGSWGTIEIDGVTPGAFMRLVGGTAGTVGKLKISDIDLRSSPGNKTYIQFGAITVGSVEVTGEITLGSHDKFISVENASANIGDLIYGKLKATGPGASGYVCYHSNGTISRLHVNNSSESGCDSLFRQAAATASAIDIYLNGVLVNGGNSGFVTYNNATIRGANVNCPSVGGFLFNCQGGAMRVEAQNVSAPAGKYARFAAGLTVSVTGLSMKVDLGANAGTTPTGMVPQPGDVVWNTNATGGGAYGRSAAGSWVSIF